MTDQKAIEPAGIGLYLRKVCARRYHELGMSTTNAIGSLFGLRRPNGNNPTTVYDHGLLWRILRDLVIVVGTLIRAAVGIFVLVGMIVLIPLLALVRALLIPLHATWQWMRMQRKVRRLRKAWSAQA